MGHAPSTQMTAWMVHGPKAELTAGPQRATFEPTTGQAAILISLGRDSASHIQLLEKIS